MSKLKATLKALVKSSVVWKLVGTLVVATGLLEVTDLVSIQETLHVIADALSKV